MKSLFAAWCLLTCLALGWHEHAIRQEHSHSTAAHAAAIAANDNAMTVSRWQATLAADVTSSMGTHRLELDRRMAGLCAAVYTLTRVVPGRVAMVREAMEACPGLPQETAGSYERLDPVAYRRRR